MSSVYFQKYDSSGIRDYHHPEEEIGKLNPFVNTLFVHNTDYLEFNLI